MVESLARDVLTYRWALKCATSSSCFSSPSLSAPCYPCWVIRHRTRIAYLPLTDWSMFYTGCCQPGSRQPTSVRRFDLSARSRAVTTKAGTATAPARYVTPPWRGSATTNPVWALRKTESLLRTISIEKLAKTFAKRAAYKNKTLTLTRNWQLSVWQMHV